ncbi:MAG: class I SAM-dependent methyltransferase [Pseudomonadales bacterium]|nr:class I SAM-dependent methyltransferase [Pseudomonadales bacterium]
MNNSQSNLQHEAFDQTRAAAFAEHIADVVDAGALSIMLSVGHRTGLLDAMKNQPPATSMEIAEMSELNERYVREWLAAMVTGGVIEYLPTDGRYCLPPEHAECMTKDATLGNLAIYSQFVALMGSVQEPMLERFKQGGGMNYQDYPCFHEIMAEDSSLTVVAGLFDHILPLIPGMEQRLHRGIDVLDAGCGRGLALIALAQRFPSSRFMGYDLCQSAIDFAKHQAQQLGLQNIQFDTKDLSGFESQESFDLIMSFDAVHDQQDPQRLLDSFCKSLRNNGVYLMQDIGGSAYLENNIDFPLATLLYAVSCFHCTPISLGQNGAGLGTMWGWETAQAMLENSGFTSINRNILPHDPTNVWFVSYK